MPGKLSMLFRIEHSENKIVPRYGLLESGITKNAPVRGPKA